MLLSLQKHQHLSWCPWEASKLLSRSVVPSDDPSPAQSTAPAHSSPAALLTASFLWERGPNALRRETAVWDATKGTYNV